MVVLYSTNCPRCRVIELKLKKEGIDFKIVTDLDTVLSIGKKAGINSAPILEVGGKFFDFPAAIKYINEGNKVCM